jgi:hypothetical protein
MDAPKFIKISGERGAELPRHIEPSLRDENISFFRREVNRENKMVPDRWVRGYVYCGSFFGETRDARIRYRSIDEIAPLEYDHEDFPEDYFEKFRYKIREKENLQSEREGYSIFARDLRAAKHTAEIHKSFSGTVLEILDSQGNRLAYKIAGRWHNQ